jgi:CheY-like chemotaxis protein
MGVTPKSPAVLVVDDDPGMRRLAASTLQELGISAAEAESAETAIVACRSCRFDLALIDLRLPGMSGLELVRTLRAEGRQIPFVLMSGWMTLPAAVEAMRLGAVDAVSLPFDIESVVRSALPAPVAAPSWPRVPIAERLTTPRSACERWAWLVLRACDAEHDPKTVSEWAADVGVSYSGLTASCRLVHVRLHYTRDLARILRVLVRNAGRTRSAELQLNVNDHRTLKTLLRRAGLDSSADQTVSPAEFLRHQRFIDPAHDALCVLETMLDSVRRA